MVNEKNKKKSCKNVLSGQPRVRLDWTALAYVLDFFNKTITQAYIINNFYFFALKIFTQEFCLQPFIVTEICS